MGFLKRGSDEGDDGMNTKREGRKTQNGTLGECTFLTIAKKIFLQSSVLSPLGKSFK